MKRDCTVRQHARKRAKQRYEVTLARNQVVSIIADIMHGRGVCVEKETKEHNVSRWLVLADWSTEPVHVVYSPERREIVTFLPPMKAKEMVR